MERPNNKLIHLIELQNEIEAKSEQLTLDTIWQTKQDLHSIILRLNGIHNSKLAINRLIPDVLYNIFAFAVYDSPIDPGTTALDISHVCRFWRKSATGWPALWGFVNLNKSRSILDLFMSRSGNAPLALSWTVKRYSSILYLASCAKFIPSRLHSLTLHFADTDLTLIRHVFHNFGLLPLRHLDIYVVKTYGHMLQAEDMQPLPDILQIDLSCLRGFKLTNMDWPWFKLPHNKLTHFSLSYPEKLPSLSTLVVFLSGFPSLAVLELRIPSLQLRDRTGVVLDMAMPSIDPSINQLVDFPNLERLTLESVGLSSYDYIRGLSAHIGALGRLSQFELTYIDHWPYINWDSTLPPFNIFEPVPSGTFSDLRVSDHRYLFLYFSEQSQFAVISAPSRTSGVSPSPPFYLSGRNKVFTNLFVDYSPVIAWIHRMPKITHLDLAYDAWKVFNSLNIRSVFPCLQTLGIWHPSANEALSVLPSDFKLKTLILAEVSTLSSDVFLDAILRTEVEVVKLDQSFYYDHSSEFAYAIATLRNRGIDVVPIETDCIRMNIYH